MAVAGGDCDIGEVVGGVLRCDARAGLTCDGSGETVRRKCGCCSSVPVVVDDFDLLFVSLAALRF